MTFKPETAVEAVVLAVEKRGAELDDRIDREQREAIEVAEKYAETLAAGGDAGRYPEPRPGNAESRWSRSRLVSYKDALAIVYDRWNEERGERANPFSPLDFLKRWRLAEYALDHLGETMLYAELGDLGAGPHGSRMQSGEVVSILAELQDTNGRDLVLRRVRIDGKVAYLLRPRQAMEDPVGFREGEDNRLRGVDATKIPLEKKTTVAS